MSFTFNLSSLLLFLFNNIIDLYRRSYYENIYDYYDYIENLKCC